MSFQIHFLILDFWSLTNKLYGDIFSSFVVFFPIYFSLFGECYTLFCCEAPEMFYGRPDFNIWGNCSFNLI